MARIRIVKLVLTAVVVLAVTVGTLPAQADDQKRTIPAKTPAIPSLTWVSCDGGFECATAQVPLDHRRPAGGTIPLALIRRQVADPAQRKGTLFLQPGGPGSSGVSFVRNSYAALPVQLRDQFDVFGFDARGVGLSGQLQCWDDAEYSRAVSAALGRPASATAFDQAVTQATSFNSACRQKRRGTPALCRDRLCRPRHRPPSPSPGGTSSHLLRSLLRKLHRHRVCRPLPPARPRRGARRRL